jgi:energy-coupling factor transporter ATP-binding protein EcfA2
MAAGIDCVAVTDHNTGAWIDRLKCAYEDMKKAAAPGFRPLTLFPGVEISVQGGIHLLAIFGPECQGVDIERLLAQVEYDGTPGLSDGVTAKGISETIKITKNAGAIPIPAHADEPGANGKALFAIREGTNGGSQVDPNTLVRVIDEGSLLATEWMDLTRPYPSCIAHKAARLTKVVGSDCHNFRSTNLPGSRWTWVKMQSPTLNGLRLALLDGAPTSVQRSDDLLRSTQQRCLDPSELPSLWLTKLSIGNARVIGLGQPAELAFNPWFNAIIGGRGSGKSTWVHALRLVLQRAGELERLGLNSEAKRQFESFSQLAAERGERTGGLRPDTVIELELERDGVPHRLRWLPNHAQGHVEEQIAGDAWQPSASQAITAERFPIQIFSQGQIAALADQGRSTLLELIDQGAGLASQSRRIEELRRTYLSQRSRLRELEGRLAERAERERELSELRRKLNDLAELDPGTVLADQQRAVRQRRELDRARQHLENLPAALEQLASQLPLDDWAAELFDPDRDSDAMAWRQEIDAALVAAQVQLQHLAAAIGRQGRDQSQHPGIQAWRSRAEAVERAAQQLQSELAERGLTDPGLMGQWLQERHRLEALLQELDGIALERQALEQANDRQWLDLLQAHQQRSGSRQAFLDGVLQANPYVRMEVVAFGYEPEAFGSQLRQLLDLDGNGFESDLRALVEQMNSATDRLDVVAVIKRLLLDEHENQTLGAKFRKNLDRKLAQPGFADAIRCWLPSDDLRITYSHRGNGRDWEPIQQGSQGQRASALLAFLLSFGDGPLVLDQPEDDLDNKLISELVVAQIRANKMRRQLLIVTHNPNVVVNADAELVTVMDFGRGQCYVQSSGALQDPEIQNNVCSVMEGGREALARRWARLGGEV